MHPSKLRTVGKIVTSIPVVLILFFGIGNSQSASSNIQTFDLSSTPADTGFDFSVFTMTEFNGDLIVGGQFFNDGDGNNTARVAGWNGSTWYPMAGLQFGPEVYALHAKDSILFAGTFRPTLSQWNGSSWSDFGPPLGDGVYGSIFAIETFNNELYVGGSFRFDPLQPSYIAKWNGSGWDTLGNGFVGTVQAMTVYKNELIVAGNRISKWNGTSWDTLGPGITGGVVYALQVYNNELIATGFFTKAGNASVTNVARWNDRFWLKMGSLGGTGRALAVHNNLLIAGGDFGWHIRTWDGGSWSGLGLGTLLDNSVHALTVYDTSLIAAGKFTNAGGGFIAKSTGTDWVAINSSGSCCSGVTGNIDCDPSGIVDIADLTVLIDHLFISLGPLCCRAAANVDGDVAAIVDIADLTFLIDHLFISLVPTAACQ